MKSKTPPPFLKGKAGAAANEPKAKRPFVGARKRSGEAVTPPSFAVHVHVNAPEAKRKLTTKRKQQ